MNINDEAQSAYKLDVARYKAGGFSRTKWWQMEKQGLTPPFIWLGKQKIYPAKQFEEWLQNLLAN